MFSLYKTQFNKSTEKLTEQAKQTQLRVTLILEFLEKASENLFFLLDLKGNSLA